MGLLERIKSVLGFETSATPSHPGTGRDRPSADEAGRTDRDVASEADADQRDEPGGAAGGSGDGVDVTVEHEPETETEEAVKGAETGTGTDADLEEIKGIGPTYADRLREAGVEGVAELATADATEVAAASDIAESRVQKWIDRAETV
jgi:predicted flap endonuclease-1-like 5' DNA nuclease